MAQIKHKEKNILSDMFRRLLLVLIAITVLPGLNSQNPQPKTQQRKRIDLRHADIDILERDRQTRKDWHRLLGNVDLKHNEITMLCDSAHWYPDKNQVTAYGNIHIEQGDTLDIYGDYLFYDGATENALLKDNVELVDKETHLYTNIITYDVKNEVAQYIDSGRIINGDNVLTSKKGTYYVAENLFHFKDSVRIVNPDYIMTADTMDYNTKSETAIFTGPSEMKGDSIYIYCERGWYDTKNNMTSIWQNSFIDNRQQIIYGDSLFYNDNTGFGESFGNISIIDTSYQVLVKGQYAWYYKSPERFQVTDSAVFIQVSDNDSLFLHSDTILVKEVSDTSGLAFRLMKAYYKCKVYSYDLQAKCDSLSYSFRDSVIRMYYEPVLWSEENQLTSDSIAIFTKNRQADRMELYNTAFIVSQVDTLRFNQIKGRLLTGYFRNNKLYKININGNGEAVYYLTDEENITGVNRATCSSIDIFIDQGKITDIIQYQSPEGTIDPPSASTQANPRLPGFSWQDLIRPKKKEDIFR
jgi:lipopolysaccharide export system protein LptA